MKTQTLQPDGVWVVDSSSTDGWVQETPEYGFNLFTIEASSFNHGGTRQMMLDRVAPAADIVIFMTQDAILADPGSLATLLQAFRDPAIAAACGRQIPHPEAKPYAIFTRLYNYGQVSCRKQLADKARLGLRTCFLSNAYAAYRVSDLLAVGGFPDPCDYGEDMFAAGKLLLEGKTIVYVAESRVYHSHDYTLAEEFLRYRAMGEFHAREPWIEAEFGAIAGEGASYALAELNYLFRHVPYLIPQACLRSLTKYLGYRVGRRRGGYPNQPPSR